LIDKSYHRLVVR